MPPLASGSSTFSVAPSAGVTQPLGAAVRMAACSLSIANLPTYTAAQLVVMHWNPQTLAPDPTTVALRTRSFTPSSLAYGRTRANFSPPVVTEALPHVADAVTTPIALDWKVTDPYNAQSVRYEANASAGLPPALQYPPGGTRQVLGGAAPTLNLYVCDGGTEYDDMRIAQAVMRTDELQPAERYEWAQRFRVPETISVGWVELAIGAVPSPYNAVVGRVAIFDGDGQASPPTAGAGSLVEAGISHYGIVTPFWANHFDFDQGMLLFPGRDYWLTFRTEHYFRPYARVLTGGEGADFTSAIGPLFSRGQFNEPWTPAPNRALNFRLIGAPYATTGVEPSTPRREGFALHVAPNPASGAAVVRWSGAEGPVRLEVLDARGRRVAAAAGAEGLWNWSGRDAAGRALPAGFYFVRACDARHRTAVQRVVRVH